MRMMTLNFLFSLPALIQASAIARPIWLCMGDCSSPVAVTGHGQSQALVYFCSSVQALTEKLVFDIDKVLRISNDLAVRILDTLFGQDSTRPIRTTPHELCVNSALLIVRVWPAGLAFHG